MNQVFLTDEIPSRLINWLASCPFSLNKKERLKRRWVSLPKFILWKLWLQYNACIFKGKTSNVAHVVAKAKTMMGDFLSSTQLPTNKGMLTPTEEYWMSSLLPNSLKVAMVPMPPTNQWEIILDSSSLTMWRK
jgi:hypothetical protein